MALRNPIVGHLRNISAKLFENQLTLSEGEDFLSFHYSHIRQNSPAPWQPCFSTNQHGSKESDSHQRKISRELFENLPTSLGEEEFSSFFRFVAMETRILHGSQNLEGILVTSFRGCFL